MQTVEDSWNTAVTKHDQFALENLLARDFVGISATGDVTTRNQQISHLFVAGAEPMSLTQKVIGARVMGDVAVVNGTYVMEWQGASDQHKIAEKGVFSACLPQEQRWKLAVHQLAAHRCNDGGGAQEEGCGACQQEQCRAAAAHSPDLQGAAEHPAGGGDQSTSAVTRGSESGIRSRISGNES